MKDKLPQATDVIAARLERLARVLDGYAKDRTEGRLMRERPAESWRAFANTCWQAAGRLDDLTANDRLREELKARCGVVVNVDEGTIQPTEAPSE